MVTVMTIREHLCCSNTGTTMPPLLLKGAKKAPKGTLSSIGLNGQLYMRTGPYLEGDGKFIVRAGVRHLVSPCGERRDP